MIDADIPLEEEGDDLVIEESSLDMSFQPQVILGEYVPKTDKQVMAEAFEKYGRDPRVEKVERVKIRRDDGSTYVRPLVVAKPDLTVGNLVFPGSGGGRSSWD